MFVYEITIFAFLFLVFLTFFKLLFWGDNEEKKMQKIFGGLIILITALLSHAPYVIFASIFISGLIVASEDFMRFLAAVMRSSGDKVAETVKALEMQKASPQEVEEKLKKESKDLEINVFDNARITESVDLAKLNIPSLEVVPAPLDVEVIRSSNERVSERAEKIKMVEELVQPYLKQMFLDAYEPHMKITNGLKSLVVDGLVRKNNKIKLIIEIRYLTAKSFPRLKYLIIGFREKLLKIGIKRRVLMIVISEEMTSQEAWSMYEENYTLANLLFFKLDQKKLELVTPQISIAAKTLEKD